MTVRQRTLDLERLGCQQRLALEDPPDQLHLLRRQARDVADGALAGLLALAPALAQRDGGRRSAAPQWGNSGLAPYRGTPTC